MTFLILWPVTSLVIQMIVFIIGCAGAYLIYFAFVEDSDEFTYEVGVGIFAGHVFGILWAVNVVKGVVWCIMAAAVALWYVRDCRETPHCTQGGTGVRRLCMSTGRVLFRHLGSVCFGAAIIALFRFIRLLFAVVEHGMRRAGMGNNMLVRLLFRCIQCCLACFEKTVEYISYWGYVFVAVHGTAFCRSCYDAFRLQMKYPCQTIVNISVKMILRLLLRITIPVGCTFFAFTYLGAVAPTHPPLLPAIVCLLSSFVIASAFSSVFDVSIDTLYLCSYEDMENSKKKTKDGKPYVPFMSDSLKAAFGIECAEKEAGHRGQRAKEDIKQRHLDDDDDYNSGPQGQSAESPTPQPNQQASASSDSLAA